MFFYYIGNMKKKFLLLLLFLVLTTNVAFSGIFSDYDFTFYKTISQSLQVFDSNKIGFDYTGFGFLGERERSGMFIRFGFQTPFSMKKGEDKVKDTIEPDTPEIEEGDIEEVTVPNPTTIPSITGPTSSSSATSSDKQPSTEVDNHEKKEKEFSSRNYSFTFIMGPATRIITADRIYMYMGAGLRFSHNILFVTNPLLNQETVEYKTQIGFDIDVGARFDINEKTSCRVGLYATSTLMSLDYLVDKSTPEGKTHSSVFFDIFNPKSNSAPINPHAYVSMGTHFTSTWKEKHYRYEITSSKLFTGTIFEL